MAGKRTEKRIVRTGSGELVEKAAGRSYRKEQRERFLVELAMSCNVTRSAKAADMAESGVYRLRKSDPAFAAQWRAALGEGYARLEMLLLRRALEAYTLDLPDASEATDKPAADAPIVKAARGQPAISERTAMALLTAHRATVKGSAAPDQASEEGARVRLERKLAQIRERLGVVPDDKDRDGADRDGADRGGSAGGE